MNPLHALINPHAQNSRMQCAVRHMEILSSNAHAYCRIGFLTVSQSSITGMTLKPMVERLETGISIAELPIESTQQNKSPKN